MRGFQAASRPPASWRLAQLAARLTERDRRLYRLVAEHRVLTSPQLAALEFGSLSTAEHRLLVLYRPDVLERFRPFRPTGSAPYHYVLGEAGALLLAAEQGRDPAAVRYRRERALAIAHSQRLPHLVGVNGFFAALAAAARARPDAALVTWWSERRCAAQWGRAVQPDGYGRWCEGGQEVDFFLEHDQGTERLDRLVVKLGGYADLAAATGVRTPVLFWLPGPGREAALRERLKRVPVPVATAAYRQAVSPAGPAWLPAGSSGRRYRLAELAAL